MNISKLLTDGPRIYKRFIRDLSVSVAHMLGVISLFRKTFQCLRSSMMEKFMRQFDSDDENLSESPPN